MTPGGFAPASQPRLDPSTADIHRRIGAHGRKRYRSRSVGAGRLQNRLQQAAIVAD